MIRKSSATIRWGFLTRQSVVLAIMFAAAALNAEEVKDQKATPVEVVNTSPIAVTGTIAATVDDGITVNDVPDELTDRLDLILDNLESLNEEGDAPLPMADFFRTWRYLIDQEIYSQGNRIQDLNARVAVHSIVISAENDEITVKFCDEDNGADCNLPAASRGIDRAAMTLGSVDKTFPGVLAMNFPVAIPVTKFRVSCWNSSDNCEVKVAIIGTEL